MRSDECIQLLKEIKRSNEILLPFNEESFRNSIRETRRIFIEAQSTYANMGKYDESQRTKALMLQLILKRNQRVLLAYCINRIEFLLSYLETKGIASIDKTSLSKAENIFITEYSHLRQKYWKSFPILNGCSIKPPGDLYIEVRVLKDCGIIQTERGELALTANSYHYLKRHEVEHLIKQGFLMHVTDT